MQTSLSTARLVLRTFTGNDFAALRDLTQQAEIIDILPDWAMSDAQLRDYLAAWQRIYLAEHEHVSEWLYAITLAKSNELIGWVGIWPKDGLQSSFPEVAYAISHEHRQCGLTTEAVAAATQAFFAGSNTAALVAIVKDWNIASRRVIEKTGFLPRGKTNVPRGETTAPRGKTKLQDDGEFDFFILPRPALASTAAVQLRPATADDAEQLTAIQRAAYQEHATRWGPWSSDSDSAGSGGYDCPHKMAYAIASSHYFAIEIAGVCIGGIAYLGPIAGQAYVEYLHVDPAFGRQGIATQALAQLEGLVPQANSWSLSTSAHSKDNERFYIKCGYQVVDRYDNCVTFIRHLRANPSNAQHHCGLNLNANDWNDCAIADATFFSSNLNGSRFIDTCMQDAQLHNVNLSRLSIGDARLGGIKIGHASWGGAHLHDLARGWHGDTDAVTIERCDLAGAQIRDCDLSQAQINSDQLDGLQINGVAYADLLAAWKRSQKT
ncbi:GNAT family N-acetyltransferase [Deefgea piscis]|uniref:GNAT family N-acetyltransferase n=1 Tax=Deefgea piscis TaxID=2739061 RepID=UPI001C7FA04A|nr:GNAT family N-acetyltransferase [Deefgea piscis]QZA82452.1 GNAT family N-acetyltransferase [Deefgea piscis]